MRTTLLAALALTLCVGAAPLAAQPASTLHRPGWLGLIFDPAADQRGVGIREVAAGSPAARAGLRTGDTVVRVDGRAANLEGLRSLRVSAGDTVRFNIRRDGRDRQVVVVAEARPVAQAGRVEGGRVLRPTQVEIVRRPGTQERVIVIDGDTTRIPMVNDSLLRAVTVQMDSVHRRMRVMLADSLPAHLRRLEAALPEVRVQVDSLRPQLYVVRPLEAGRQAVGGAEFTDLNPGLAEYFGAERGALVLRVASESPAARAGLAAGDVVVRVGTVPVAGVAEMREQIGRGGRAAVQLEVVRRGQRRQLTLSP